MKEIQLTAKFKVHKGKLDEFKKIAAECVAAVKEKEKGKGALQYDWFFSADESECIVRETYVDSGAVLTHMGNVGEMLGQLLSMSDFELEVYGNPSEELQKASAALAPTVYSFHQGI